MYHGTTSKIWQPFSCQRPMMACDSLRWPSINEVSTWTALLFLEVAIQERNGRTRWTQPETSTGGTNKCKASRLPFYQNEMEQNSMPNFNQWCALKLFDWLKLNSRAVCTVNSHHKSIKMISNWAINCVWASFIGIIPMGSNSKRLHHHSVFIGQKNKTKS